LCSEQIFIKCTNHQIDSFYSQAKMLGGLCVGKVGVQVACVFLQTTALMIQKAPRQNTSINQQQKLWPLASSALKSASASR
jgi:hypothetical protein